MNEPNILRCPYCQAGQGEIGSRITYRRKRGAVCFEPKGTFRLDCYGCGKSSYFKRGEDGEMGCFEEKPIGEFANNETLEKRSFLDLSGGND